MRPQSVEAHGREVAFLNGDDPRRGAAILCANEAKPALACDVELHVIAIVPMAGATDNGTDRGILEAPNAD
jgi:hypothetical protein